MGQRKKQCGYHGVWSAPEGLGIWELSRHSGSAELQEGTILEAPILNFPVGLVSKHIQRLSSACWSRFFCLWTIKLAQAQNGIYWLKYLRMSQGHVRLIKVFSWCHHKHVSLDLAVLLHGGKMTPAALGLYSTSLASLQQESFFLPVDLAKAHVLADAYWCWWSRSGAHPWINQWLEQCWLKSGVLSWNKGKIMITATTWIESREHSFSEAVVNVGTPNRCLLQDAIYMWSHINISTTQCYNHYWSQLTDKVIEVQTFFSLRMYPCTLYRELV